MAATTGMKPHGFYDRHSGPQARSIEAVLPWLLDALPSLPLSDRTGPVTIADFGCSEGRNAIAAMYRITAALRTHTDRPIQAVFSDLPTNDFVQLYENLMPDGRSVLATPEVYSAVVGGSMFERLLPSDTLTLATTYNAIGWLSRKPEVPLANYILAMGPREPQGDVFVSDADRAAYALQAAEDLRVFYNARAASMIPGGKLLVASFDSGEQHRCCDGIYDVLDDALRDLVAAGTIARSDYQRLVFPVYFRTVPELIAPCSDGSLPFRIDRAEAAEVPVPFNEELRRSGNVEAFAADYAAFIRAFSEPVVRSFQSNASERDPVIDQIYERVRSLLIERPQAYELRFVQVAALLTRL